MNLRATIAALCASGMLAGCSHQTVLPEQAPTAAHRSGKTNFVTIVIDDMGYSDIALFGGEVETPNIEALAADSMILSDFYAAASSSPSRAMLFTGKDNHSAGMGSMAETLRDEQRGQPGYEGVMSLDVPNLAELLHDGGYHTMFTGKWHLGGHEEGEEAYFPYNRGFDQTRGVVLPGGEVTYITGKDGELITEHPASHRFGRASMWNENGHEMDMSGLPPFQIAEDLFTDQAFRMLDTWKATDGASPFYLNMSYIAPHQPLQAPKARIDSMVPVYMQGWDKIREARFARLKARGLLPADTVLPPMPANVPAWDSLSPRKQAFEAHRMAVYAAEIKTLDENIGRLVAKLKALGEYDNTVFFVYSDNGASNSSFGHMPANFTYHEYDEAQLAAMGEGEFQTMLGEMGSAYSWLGPNNEWATVMGTPHRGVKGDTFDGGLIGMAFVTYPGVTQGQHLNNCLWSVTDLLPTMLDIADINYPAYYHGAPTTPMDGVSMVPMLTGREGRCNTERVLGFEVDGIRGLRYGDWKISQGWNHNHLYLFNVAEDPFEEHDLSASNPEKMAEMLALYQAYARNHQVYEVNTQKLPELIDGEAKVRAGVVALDALGLPMAFYKAERSLPGAAVISLAGEVRPAAAHVGKPGKLFVEVIAETQGGSKQSYFLTEAGLQAGKAGSRVALKHYDALPEMTPMEIYNGPFSALLSRLGSDVTQVHVVLGYKPDGLRAIDNRSGKAASVTLAE